ncbi:pyridoxamine 5'-phosphate oxidase [Candidatus Entotheonella palauensis]|uniref:Pyridoxamine 5'-phosphate oxidase n=1 Tax=Candidatus Entotheonella gemina TaxID=1429439 RepID=W4LL36_9BACT|nr:pyridoxamine 5'-phosphate oxidase [Candidatus Entotheonella palauensis]ETW98629.1 MAG: pyridoxamine 5'-phosphate oxidase [Candidatus Entotheonella gemina]
MTDAPRDPRQISDLNPDPIAEFTDWFEAAKAAGASRPDAMVLATATEAGVPSARMVFLRGFDARGWVFYTNYESRKGQEMKANPAAALMFYWDAISRSVRVEGQVEKTTTEESERYFGGRPRDSQLGAWASQQSRVIAGREVLDERMAQLSHDFCDRDVTLPPFWGGYRVVPERIEFWISRPSRLHDRFCYRKQADGTWKIVRLSP